jgi:hypothetical protein
MKVIIPKEVKMGNSTVKRILPRIEKRTIGPFVFLDQIGPEWIPSEKGIEVLPHPHIGLSTVTYLYQGELLHRDSIGSVQGIHPLEINWMTAGRGISHSERSSGDLTKKGFQIHGLQFWVGLPIDKEEMPPEFQHIPEKSLPIIQEETHSTRVLAGVYKGYEASTKIQSPLLLLDVRLDKGSRYLFESSQFEIGIYIVKGKIKLNDTSYSLESLLVPESNDSIEIIAEENSILCIFGGEEFKEPRFMDWNFVSSDKEKIQRAKKEWSEQNREIYKQIPNETDYIPYPIIK